MAWNPYGKDAFKYGSTDNQAMRDRQAERAQRNAPSPSRRSTFDAGSSLPNQYGNQYPSAGRSTGGGGALLGLGKLIVIGVVLLLVVGYFQSQSDPVRPSRPAPSATLREPYPLQGTDTPRPAPPVQSVETSAPSSLRLSPQDQRVFALIDDVRQLSGQALFLAKDGESIFFQENLATPAHNIYQETFNVADLDLSRSTYPVADHNLNIPCKANTTCITYKIFEGSTAQEPGDLKQKTVYQSVNVWSPSEDTARRILQDLQQLQSMQR